MKGGTCSQAFARASTHARAGAVPRAARGGDGARARRTKAAALSRRAPLRRAGTSPTMQPFYVYTRNRSVYVSDNGLAISSGLTRHSRHDIGHPTRGDRAPCVVHARVPCVTREPAGSDSPTSASGLAHDCTGARQTGVTSRTLSRAAHAQNNNAAPTRMHARVHASLAIRARTRTRTHEETMNRGVCVSFFVHERG